MENKKILPIKIIHALLMIAALVMSIMEFAKLGSIDSIYTASVFPALCTITNILALIVGFIYLFKGYKKNANVYYKVFMGLCVLFSVLHMTAMSRFIMPYTETLVYMIAAIMLVILAVGKDLGKRNTYIVFAIMMICRLIPLFTSLSSLQYFGEAGFGMLSQVISNILIAGTVGFMVTGKYLDKDERGAN